MTTRHAFGLACACPVDGSEDAYDVVVETARTVPVEAILDAAKRATSAPAFQEEVTQKIADELGCKVTTVGYHGPEKRVRTTVEALP